MEITKKKVMLTAVFALTTAGTCLANTPPPPVNQILGIPDSSFNNLVEANCRACHEDQTIVNPGTIPDRHHLLVNKTIPTQTDVPFPQAGVTAYQCLSCHQQVWDTTTSSYVFDTFRDCLYCHDQVAGEASVHHLTAKAQSQDCKACHGPIDNPLDGHYIPSYEPSLVTPWPSDKPNADVNGEGQCVFCHESGTDTASGLFVLTNADTHHSTGLGLGASAQCQFCHDFTVEKKYYIRKCEACHGVASLHNIQVDSDNPANVNSIVPGAENPYWGHIGHNDDCYGCHGFSAMSAAAPYSGPVIPDVSALDVTSVTSGTAATVTATGMGFTNVVIGVGGEEIGVTSKVMLTADDGTFVELIPSAISATSVEVTVPADLAPGNYDFRVVKADKTSNAVNLRVIPAMANQSITCRGTSVTIEGTGYSQHVDALNSGTGLSATDKTGAEVDCAVRTWTDTSISATCSVCPSSVTVNSIWGADNDRVRTLRPTRR